MNEKLYKVLAEDGEPYYGGVGTWSLPTKNDDGTWTPGEWMPVVEGELVPCENGYHLCRADDLVYWLGPKIYEAEYRGERIDDDTKIVVREARLLHEYENWNDKTARLFACWCVRQVWYLLEDERSQTAVEVAERYANGEATYEKLAAAGAAARDAAGDAAEAAASAAASAAAWAAWDAAGAAAVAAAWDVDRTTQSKRLVEILEE